MASRSTCFFNFIPEEGMTWAELSNVFRDVQWRQMRVRNIGLVPYMFDYLWTCIQFKEANGSWPKKDDLPMPKVYQTMRAVDRYLRPGNVSTLGQIYTQTFRRRKKELMSGERTADTFRRDAPILCRAQDGYKLEKVDGQYWVTVNLYAPTEDLPTDYKGRQMPAYSYRVRLKIQDARQRKEIEALETGRWKRGVLSLCQKRRKGTKQWGLRFSYSYEPTVVVKTGGKSNSAVLHVGVNNFFVLMSTDGDRWRVDGGPVAEHLRRVSGRRESMGRRLSAGGNRGHGRKRRIKPTETLRAKHARWRDNYNHNLAREIVRWCQQHDVDELVIGDMEGIREKILGDDKGNTQERHLRLIHGWPYYDLITKVIDKAQLYGLEARKTTSAYVSMTCPNCGVVNEKNKQLHGWMLSCVACDFWADLDNAACLNLMAAEWGETRALKLARIYSKKSRARLGDEVLAEA